MLNSLLFICIMVCYLGATVLIASYIRTNNTQSGDTKPLKLASFFSSIGVMVHLIYAYQISFINHSLNFSAHSMLVFISAILVLTFNLISYLMPIRRLGVLIFPFVILSLLFTVAWNNPLSPNSNTSIYLTSHILTSILAYSLLTIATIQGLLYFYQERQLKQRTTPAMLMALPPLQTMEKLLFRLVGIGFVLLTLTLFSGIIFSQEIFGRPFSFTHHTILAFLGWLVFAVMLFKRIKEGFRGSKAVMLCISGFLLIQLGYFGTKIVSEIIAVN